jgi:hypothetical protein
VRYSIRLRRGITATHHRIGGRLRKRLVE